MNRIFGIIFLSTAFCCFGISQSPTPTPSPAAFVKMSEVLAKRLETFDAKTGVSREDREQAYTKLMQAQRYIWLASRMRSQAGVTANMKLARTELQNCLELNPGVAEAYAVLAESWVNPNIQPNDVD